MDDERLLVKRAVQNYEALQKTFEELKYKMSDNPDAIETTPFGKILKLSKRDYDQLKVTNNGWDLFELLEDYDIISTIITRKAWEDYDVWHISLCEKEKLKQRLR